MRKLCLILCFVFIFLNCTACTEYTKNIDNYYTDVKENKADLFMPDLNSIGDYKDIIYVCRKEHSIFFDRSIQLIVKYDKETFLKEKDRLKNAYTYITEPEQHDSLNNEYTIPVEKFSVANFDFKIAKFEDTVYPKNFGMIGISDSNQEIAYLWIYAPDLDFICSQNEDRNEKMLEFIDYYFALADDK